MEDFIQKLAHTALLTDGRTREIVEKLSKLKSLSDAYSILQYRSYCCNLLQMVIFNFVAFATTDERQTCIDWLNSEIKRCDVAMQTLQNNVALDMLFSIATQPYIR